MRYFAFIAVPLNRKLRKTEPNAFTPTQAQLESLEKVDLPTIIDVTESRQTISTGSDANADQLGVFIITEKEDKSLRSVVYFSKK